MRTYKLYATALTNSAATVTIQRSGRIKSIRWSITVNDTTDNHTLYSELSTTNVSQYNVNDTLNALDQVNLTNNIGAAGAIESCVQKQCLMDYPVVAGERLYINNQGDVSACVVTCFVDVQD